jgi:DNA-binding SARP family transcriptional activator/WD40 repeat protein
VGARLQFSILGPLEIRRGGVIVGIGGPRQRALLALLLCNANRVLSRDRLIDELLADQLPRSPERMLRVQVSRLRKALDDGDEEPRLLSRPPGYVLRVDRGELDLDEFEALVRDGRGALERDAPGQAARFLRSAESLWRGRPLADLESEPFARFEARRLEEVRLVALEERIEAELALGHHADLSAELTRLISEYPLRERLRGQLMLALYRSGRQADALAVYRQTGEMLRDELGLDPGRALRELERSILLQDAALDDGGRVVVATGDHPPDVCPFKGLEFFDRADAEYFCGRERMVGELLARLPESSLVGILGASGVGKSSLLCAGVLAVLAAGELPGSAGWRQVLLRPGERPCAELARALGGECLDTVLAALAPGERLVLAVDQLEELFTACEREDERAAFLEQLSGAACDPERRALVLIASRGDFYTHFAPYGRFAQLLSSSHVLVRPMDRDELAQAIEQPAARAGLEIEHRLVDALVADAAAVSGGLPLLSAMLVELWHARDDRALRFESYRASGRMDAAVARLAEAAYAGLDERERDVARSVMLRLASDQDGSLVRRRVPVAELERIDDANPVVAALIDARLLTLSDGRIDLAHEALLSEWPRYRGWLDEDREGRRLHAPLTAAASEWEAEGRDPGGLYRGARLAGALDWVAAHGDRLNSLEREFLDRSRIESQREQRRHRTQNRRLWGLLLAVVVLLIAAIGAAIVARVKQQSASKTARAALGRQLGAEAVNEPRLDLAMLMAREAINLDRSPQTENSLLETLVRSPAVIRTVALPADTTAALAYSPDGRTLAVADGLGDLRLLDARTHALLAASLGGLSELQVPDYSSDGSLIAFRSPGACGCAFISVHDARTLQLVANLSVQAATPPAPVEIPGGSIAISGDDRTLYYAYWSTGDAGGAPAAYVERWSLPSARPLPEVRIGSQPLLAMRVIDSGLRLEIVSTREVRVYGARSLRLLHSVAITPSPSAPAAAAISPDGRTAVTGSRAGAVIFIDTSTGRVRRAAAGQGARIISVVYAQGGRTVATVGDDDTIIAWNPRTAGALERLTGPPGQVAGAAISPDGDTLYTSSQDGVLLEWDMAGNRRFGIRATVGAGSRCCDPVVPETPPLALSPDGSRFAVRVAPSEVGMFSTRTLRRVGEFTVGPDTDAITALSFSPAGHQLAVAGHAGLVQLWSVTGTPRLLRSLAGLGSMFGQSEAIQALAFSPDGRLVAASDDDKTGSIGGGPTNDDNASLAIWQARSGRLVVSPTGLTSGHIFRDVGDDLLAFSPDGRLLAMTLFDGSIMIVDPWTGTLVQAFTASAGSTALAFAPDGTLADGTQAGTVEWWNPRTGKQIRPALVAATTAVESIAFDRTGQRLATAGLGQGAVTLWLASTLQQQRAALETDPGTTSNVAFERSGGGLLAMDSDGNALTWPTSLTAWEQHACAVAGRSITRAEWSQLNTGRPYSSVC